MCPHGLRRFDGRTACGLELFRVCTRAAYLADHADADVQHRAVYAVVRLANPEYEREKAEANVEFALHFAVGQCHAVQEEASVS